MRGRHVSASSRCRTNWPGEGCSACCTSRGHGHGCGCDCSGEGPSAEFDSNIVAATLAGQWFFWWPWAEPIGPTVRLAHVARSIVDDLGLCRASDPATQDVPSLAMRRTLRQRREPIPCVPSPGGQPGVLPGKAQCRWGTGRLADDLYLLAHHEMTGKPHLQPRALGLGLAGALLAELMLAGAHPLWRGLVMPGRRCPARGRPEPAPC